VSLQKSGTHPQDNPESASASRQACLVDGDPVQLTRAHRLRRGSLLISVIAQIVILATLVLVPLFWRTERIALANIMPMPTYHRVASANHSTQHPHFTKLTTGLSFCLTCRPVLPHKEETATGAPHTGEQIIIGEFPGAPECSDCASLVGKTNSQPVIPHAPTASVVHVGHLDPAMLIHRVEPVFPPLALQTRREGTVELHAIIATDGSVISLQFLAGDALFAQSALDAVRQWRYNPTSLNGHPVEVDTHITVIYKLNH
jgi:TonB family protein